MNGQQNIKKCEIPISGLLGNLWILTLNGERRISRNIRVIFCCVNIWGFIFINISVSQECAFSEDKQESIIIFINYASFGRGMLY